MAERNQRIRPTITETVETLSGGKVLLIKVDGDIRGVQTASVVNRRIEDVEKIIDVFDANLAMSDDEHLTAAQNRIDDRIADLEKRKAALTAEGVTATAKARVNEKRLALIAQRDALVVAAAEMAAEPATGE